MIVFTVFVLMAGLYPAVADPNPSSWENWKTNFDLISVPPHEIQSGGPSKDGIPSIDKPKFSVVGEVNNIGENEPVIGLEIDGDARAYPLSVLMWHEIANDVVGGIPVAVTYCPLCNAAIVFDARYEGKKLDFGTTGRLRHSDLLMYDRQTESWWQQFSGEAIIGDLLGARLDILPSRLESFGNFKKRHPKAKILVPNNPGFRRYGQNPYVGYDTLDRPFLYGGPLPEDFPAMARVVVVRQDSGPPIILSMQGLRKSGTRSIGGHEFSWSNGQASALDSRDISAGRDVGNVTVINLKNGEDVAYDVTFAFVAHAFHPEVSILE
ncbi:MAG: DUF3179 domain-containing protein [Rhizobiaceae bacterium]